MPAPREVSFVSSDLICYKAGRCHPFLLNVRNNKRDWDALGKTTTVRRRRMSYPTTACADVEIAHRLCILGLFHQNEVAGVHRHLVGDYRG